MVVLTWLLLLGQSFTRCSSIEHLIPFQSVHMPNMSYKPMVLSGWHCYILPLCSDLKLISTEMNTFQLYSFCYNQDCLSVVSKNPEADPQTNHQKNPKKLGETLSRTICGIPGQENWERKGRKKEKKKRHTCHFIGKSQTQDLSICSKILQELHYLQQTGLICRPSTTAAIYMFHSPSLMAMIKHYDGAH